MTRLGILALALTLFACGPSRRRWIPRDAPPGSAPAAYAMVWSGTPLHVAPDERAATVASTSQGFLPVRVLREREGWAHLETLGEPADAHCAEGLPHLAPYRLRLFAPARTLVPLTIREVTQTFDDETSVHLARGVPLERMGRDLFRAHLGDASVVVRLDSSSVGTRYLPSPPIERGGAAHVLSRDALLSSVPILGVSGRLVGAAALPVHAQHARGSEAVVEVRPRCARIRVRTPAHTVVETSAPPDPPVEPAPASLEAARGATVYWANGVEAGVVTAPAPLRDETDSVDGRRCFRQPLEEGRTVVMLCFDPRDVVTPGAGAARQLDAPG